MTDGMIWAIIIGGFIVCLAFVAELFAVVERRDMRDYRERTVYQELDFLKADIAHIVIADPEQAKKALRMLTNG